MDPIAIKNEFKTVEDVLDARFSNITDILLNVPGVSNNQIKKGSYQYNKTSRIIEFKMISK